MFFVNTNMGGTCIAMAPDVGKTPSPGGPVPVPYPNMSMLVQVIPVTAAKFTKILNRPVVLANSTVSMSSGDEGATAGGGVVSNLIKGPTQFTTFSKFSFFEGQPVTYHTADTKQNGSNANTIGKVAAPSQTLVTVSG
ncbi:MAG: PAAR-like domain-containing protein [Kiloniellaceae bacterium]